MLGIFIIIMKILSISKMKWKRKKEVRLVTLPYKCMEYSIYHRRVTSGGEGGGLPCPFSKIWKKCPNFGKKIPWLWSSMG